MESYCISGGGGRFNALQYNVLGMAGDTREHAAVGLFYLSENLMHVTADKGIYRERCACKLNGGQAVVCMSL